jgi:hypothetical protein
LEKVTKLTPLRNLLNEDGPLCGLTDIDKLIVARDLVRQVKLDVPVDEGTTIKRGCEVGILGIEAAWEALENKPEPWCVICYDKGGPGPLDPCEECGRYGDLPEQPKQRMATISIPHDGCGVLDA